jgi:hypothetical protein
MKWTTYVACIRPDEKCIHVNVKGYFCMDGIVILKWILQIAGCESVGDVTWHREEPNGRLLRTWKELLCLINGREFLNHHCS